jgi:ATP-dependent protease Clp ATPase subunit
MRDGEPKPQPQPFPWYDGRVETVRKEYVNPWAEEDEPEQEQYDTPRAIYDYLNRKVWKQDAAKKAAIVIACNTFKRSVKSNAMFIGPSGCGKTCIWRCLQKIFLGRIVVSDSSSITLTSWKGDKTWSDLLRSLLFRNGHHNILTLDEADKLCAPKFSDGENVSHSIQSEGLTMLEGAFVDVKISSVIHSTDTSKISFVLCGAFSNKAHNVAEKSAGSWPAGQDWASRAWRTRSGGWWTRLCL